MSRRTVTVNGQEYKYVIGRTGTKIDGVGFQPRAKDYQGNYLDYEITPYDVMLMIENGVRDGIKKFPNKNNGQNLHNTKRS